MTNLIDIVGGWTARLENADAVAKRLARWFAMLAEIDPLFVRWKRGGMRHRSVVPQMIDSTALDVAELRAWVAENPEFETREGYKQELGFRVHARTPQETGLFADFWLWTRNTQLPGWFHNRMSVTLFPIESGDPEYFVPLTRTVLLASAVAWDCEWAAAAPGNYGRARIEPGRLPPQFESGWMVYLDETRAGKMLDGDVVSVEKLATGGVFLTAIGQEIFDRNNIIHRAAARRIESALAPLNAKAAG